MVCKQPIDLNDKGRIMLCNIANWGWKKKCHHCEWGCYQAKPKPLPKDNGDKAKAAPAPKSKGEQSDGFKPVRSKKAQRK